MNKMKNRLLTVLLTAILVINIIPTAFSAESADTMEKEMDFLKNIGGFSKVDISADSLVTRGEFASILANICKINSSESGGNNWNEEVFGTDNNDTLIIEEDSGLKFEDVDTTYPYYNEILAITTRGYMKGVSENLFAPEFGITLLNASKVMLDILGYETYAKVYGGYPAGYQTLASDMGLTDGVAKNFNDTITQKDLAKIIYNALDVNLLKITSIEGGNVNFEPKDGETFMTEILKLDKYSGVVTDNGITSFYSESKLGGSKIKIEDAIFNLADSTEYIRDYIGRHINVYVSNEDDEMTIVYAALSGKDEIFEFSIDDMEEYSDDSITYYDGKKNVVKKISKDACLISNGIALKNFNEDTFKFDSGNVKLISADNSYINLIIIDKYEYMYVKKVDQTEEVIYGSFVDENQMGETIDLSEKGGYENISITDENENNVTITDIYAGQVLKISESGSVINIEIVNKKVEGFKLNSIYYEDDDTFIKGDSGEFKIAKEYLSSTYKVAIKTGENYNLYLGEDNLVVWMGKTADEYGAGFLVKAFQDEADENLINLKLYGFDGKMQIVQCQEKIKILAPDGKKYNLIGENAYNLYLNGTNSVIRYSLNDEGKITYIELPTEEKNKNGQLFKLIETDENTSSDYSWYGQGTIGNAFHYDSDTKFIKIPADLSDDSKYSVPNYTSYWGMDNTRPLIAYASKPNTVVADYIVFKTEANEVSVVGDKRDFIVVENITEELKDDEIVNKITGMQVGEDGTKRIELYSKKGDNGIDYTWFENVPDTFQSKTDGKTNLYNVQKGDIIRAIYDEYNMVSAADILYRPTAENPTAPGSKSGFLLGSTGIKGDANGNPYRLAASGALASSSTHYRGAFGWVIRCEGTNILQVTGKDLSVGNVDIDNIDSKFLSETFKITGQTLVVNYSNNKVTVEEGDISDIRSYEEAGANCSRVFYHMYWGTRISTIIINGTM